jgi:hypothetical protein
MLAILQKTEMVLETKKAPRGFLASVDSVAWSAITRRDD